MLKLSYGSSVQRYGLGAPRGHQKQGKPYSNDRSSSFRSQRKDRTAKLTHEDKSRSELESATI